MKQMENRMEIRHELEKILAVVDGPVGTIERDIVLERLRRVYEAFLEADCKPDHSPEPEIDVVSTSPSGQEEPEGAAIPETGEWPPVGREIIESLYGGAELCRKKGEKETTPEPAAEEAEMPSKEVASMLSAQPASRLRNVIGLNDRLMLLNDLFDSDALLYERTLDILDACGNIDDAYIYLYERFTMDDSKDGVRLLIALLESKFS